MRSDRVSSNWLLTFVILLTLILFVIFFFDYFRTIDRQILSHQDDWAKELQYYGNIEYQLFTLHQFPHAQTQTAAGTNALFANPETAILTPLTLFLPFLSVYNFFILHLGFYYLIGLIGVTLLRQVLDLPYFSILLMFSLFAFNGRLLANYDVGHSMFLTFMGLPLLLYFYLSFMKLPEPHSLLSYAWATALVMTMIFFAGGAHLINWIILFFLLDAILLILAAVSPFAQPRFRRLLLSLGYILLSATFFVVFSAIKLLPARLLYGQYDPVYISGYSDIQFFFQSFYQTGLGASKVWPELWREEAYNFIGSAAFIFALAALFYAVCISRNGLIRRLGLIAVLCALLSFDDIYQMLFQSIPFLKGERVGSRYVFVTLALVAILTPVGIHALLRRLKIGQVWQEMVMALGGLIIYGQLYWESRAWLLTISEPFTPQLTPAAPGLLPDNYFFYFYTGLFISVAGFLVISLLVARNLIVIKPQSPPHSSRQNA